MSGPTDDERARCATVRAAFQAAPFYDLLGIRVETERPGTSRLTLSNRAELRQSQGGVHGGALMSLADSAMGVALGTALREGDAWSTVEMTTQFLEPVGGSDVVAEAAVARLGRTLAFLDCSLESEGRLVARARAIFRVRRA
ncbi:MAG: PaaI family thioesterase [Deltaproteobacteria bacterium]|nr:PaaI family thioesterase [Deltaproteobacteria bacterium]